MCFAVNRHTDFRSGLSMVPQTVLVDFQFSRRDTLVVQSGTDMNILEFVGSSACVGVVIKVSRRHPESTSRHGLPFNSISFSCSTTSARSLFSVSLLF